MSLFWKIFGWFWVSQMIVLCTILLYSLACGTLIYTPEPTSPSQAAKPLWPPHSGVEGKPIGTFSLEFDPTGGLLLPCLFIGTEALVCYLSARYLAAPATKLRRATRLLAEGDLSARVGPQMGRRRDELADMGRDFDLMAERIETLVASERRLAESERRLAESERHTVEAQQRLLADISHELRSPLARISYALTLAQRSADDKTGGYLERITRESALLNELIGQLLTLASLEAAPDPGEAERAAAPIALSEVVSEVCQDAEFEARGRGQQVRLLQNQACLVRGRADLLRSAVENVVRNAMRYAPPESAIEVALCRDGEQAFITVRDFGIGVPEQVLGELFKPFYRVDAARERETGGVGLGLSITERAIRFHGGRVQAKNAVGGGLVVELMLPLAQ